MITEKHNSTKYDHHNDLQSFAYQLNKPLMTKKALYNTISDLV